MATLSEQDRQRLAAATRERAIAFVEDIQHMRATLAQGPFDRGSLRRISAILRRLLVNREIQEVAAPRLGRFIVDAPNEKPTRKHIEEFPPLFFATAGGTIRFENNLAIDLRHIVLEKPDVQRSLPQIDDSL